MCGRFTVHDRLEELEEFYRLLTSMNLSIKPELRDNWRPLFNIAPTQPIFIIRPLQEGEQPDDDTHGQQQTQLTVVQWGLIPLWAKDPSIGSKMINARSETAAEKPSFRAPMKYRRCVIPVNGFYEWQSRANVGKQPFYVSSKFEPWMLLAGLWDHWTGPDGSEIETATILTTSANEFLKPLHQRMPVILPPSEIKTWLDHDHHPKQVQHLLQPASEDQLQMWPVTTKINRPTFDTPDAIVPLHDEGETDQPSVPSLF